MTIVVMKRLRREKKKAVVRNKIITTAIELFAKHGIDNVTMEHLADVADIGKGTIYNYFPTKEDIVVAYVIERELRVQARLAKLSASKGTLEEVLLEYLHLNFRLKRKYHKFVRVFFAKMFSQTDLFLPYMAEMQKSINDNLCTLFYTLEQRGLVRTDIPLADLVLVFKTMHMGLNALWAVEGPPFRNAEMVMQQQMKLFCEGLENKSAKGGKRGLA